MSLPQERRAEWLVLQAIASHDELGSMLVLKGAHAIEALTGTARSTRDIDLTARQRFVDSSKDGAAKLKRLLREALEDYLAKDTEWTVYATSAEPSPTPRRHRFGWDGFLLKATLKYRQRAHHVVEIDLSFGDLTEGTLSMVWHDDVALIQEAGQRGALAIYGVEQAIAEKLRAWLQKLPPYLNKVGSGSAQPRVRDLRDIHMLLSRAGDTLDWPLLGRCFVTKCRVRFVDCESTADLLPDAVSIELVRSLYLSEIALSDVPFEDAWRSIHALVDTLATINALPGRVPLPDPTP